MWCKDFKYGVSLLLILLAASFTLCMNLSAEEDKSIYDISFEELAKLKIRPSFALTPVNERDIPSTYTIITREMIEQSGARSLDEVLTIYVPSMHSLNQVSTGRFFTLRGLSTNDTILMLVNGRVMNDRVFYGAQSERFLSMLGDIDYIEIIRGPGAAVHGAGAIAGVINIKTLSGRVFQGTEIKLRQGAIEQFSSMELKLGHSFADDSSIFFYYGIDEYQGADTHYAPVVIAHPQASFGKGTVLDSDIANHNQSFRELPRHKLHLQYDTDSSSSWLRYTRGGEMHTRFRNNGVFEGGIGYQQLTFFTQYFEELTDDLKLDLKLSYDIYDSAQIRSEFYSPTIRNRDVRFAYSTRRLFTHIGLIWQPIDNQYISLSYEYSDERMYDNTFGWPYESIRNSVVGNLQDPWSIDFHSIIAEYQWQVDPKWTWFLGGRADKHKFMPWLYSPRTAFVFKPDENDTFKFVYNNSQRRNDESSLLDFETSQSEQIHFYELSHRHDFGNYWVTQISAYYAWYDLIAYSSTTASTVALGELEYTGLDFELTYHGEDWTMILSNSFVKLINFRLNDPSVANSISSEPQGWGNDFMQADNLITKLYFNYKIRPDFIVDTSVMAYWGTPGKEDYFEGLRQVDIPSEAYGESIFLNMGLSWNITVNSKLRFDAHNILGWADSDFNKRSYSGRAHYQNDAPAFSLSYYLSF